MKVIVEHFVTFLFILVFLWIGVSFIMQNIEHSSARAYHEAVISRMENSGMDVKVIQKCKDEAQKSGYKLTVDQVGSGEEKDSRVTLQYQCVMPLTKVTTKYTLQGYAR